MEGPGAVALRGDEPVCCPRSDLKVVALNKEYKIRPGPAHARQVWKGQQTSLDGEGVCVALAQGHERFHHTRHP